VAAIRCSPRRRLYAGRRETSSFAYKGLLNIRKGQVAQTARDRWVARVVPGPRYTAADGEQLLANIATWVSPHVNIAIQVVDDIPHLPSGKYTWVSQEWRRQA
jgi:hypothetical protein